MPGTAPSLCFLPSSITSNAATARWAISPLMPSNATPYVHM
jgi:hypothetical protein